MHQMCMKTRGATLGALKCREPELLHDEDEEGARVTCEELRDLEVGYEYDYFNHVPRETLIAHGLQGYVFSMHWSLPHYYIDRSYAVLGFHRRNFFVFCCESPSVVSEPIYA